MANMSKGASKAPIKKASQLPAMAAKAKAKGGSVPKKKMGPKAVADVPVAAKYARAAALVRHLARPAGLPAHLPDLDHKKEAAPYIRTLRACQLAVELSPQFRNAQYWQDVDSKPV